MTEVAEVPEVKEVTEKMAEAIKPSSAKFGGRREPRDSVPEWMDVPVNQDDMMELRGFDDSPEKEVKPKKETKLDRKEDKKPKPNDEFNIDDIIHMDVIPGRICLQLQIFNVHLTSFL